jgi:hypothetical protein
MWVKVWGMKLERFYCTIISSPQIILMGLISGMKHIILVGLNAPKIYTTELLLELWQQLLVVHT